MDIAKTPTKNMTKSSYVVFMCICIWLHEFTNKVLTCDLRLHRALLVCIVSCRSSLIHRYALVLWFEYLLRIAKSEEPILPE